jgi:hypothetical protein
MFKALNVPMDVVDGLIRKTKANLINSNKSKEKQVKNIFYAKYGDKHTQQIQVEDPLGMNFCILCKKRGPSSLIIYIFLF